ncbi:MAG: IS200/IS605 family transposase [Candidatus Thermoplasmatota archaeon]|nr:IS200/IS605 family transposase [Candidatus Thermoplasmatota archaeon]
MEIINKEKEYHHEDYMVYSCQYHVIFCPKYRRSVLIPPIDKRLKELILERQKDYQYKVLEMEVMPDHVHLLIDVNPRIGVYYVVSRIKGYTSHVLREEFPELRKRLPTLWTHSKFISSVGAVTLEVVMRYIEEQKGV